jgi:hypothetical protein
MIDILNALIKVIGVVVGQIVGLLPTSPIALTTDNYTGLHTYMGYAAWFLPLAEIGTFVTAVAAATLIWYGLRIVLRFFRVVTS